jgi:hypothetical protein
LRSQATPGAAATTAAGLALAACSAGTTAAGTTAARSTAAAGAPAPTSAAGASGATAPAEPKTAAAVRADADDYLTLYSAGQFAVTYQMLSASARRAITQPTWVAVHQSCPGLAAGMGYQIKHVAVAGKTAAVTVALSGAVPKLGTNTETLVYADGHWGISPADLSLYRHGSVPADVAAAKASGRCPS